MLSLYTLFEMFGCNLNVNLFEHRMLDKYFLDYNMDQSSQNYKEELT